jgi:hypothetical protein
MKTEMVTELQIEITGKISQSKPFQFIEREDVLSYLDSLSKPQSPKVRILVHNGLVHAVSIGFSYLDFSNSHTTPILIQIIDRNQTKTVEIYLIS